MKAGRFPAEEDVGFRPWPSLTPAHFHYRLGVIEVSDRQEGNALVSVHPNAIIEKWAGLA